MIGLIGAKCDSKCPIVLHIILSIVCIIVFAAISILTGLWLGEKNILPVNFSNNNDTMLNIVNFQNLCQDFDLDDWNDSTFQTGNDQSDRSSEIDLDDFSSELVGEVKSR